MKTLFTSKVITCVDITSEDDILPAKSQGNVINLTIDPETNRNMYVVHIAGRGIWGCLPEEVEFIEE